MEDIEYKKMLIDDICKYQGYESGTSDILSEVFGYPFISDLLRKPTYIKHKIFTRYLKPYKTQSIINLLKYYNGKSNHSTQLILTCLKFYYKTTSGISYNNSVEDNLKELHNNKINRAAKIQSLLEDI